MADLSHLKETGDAAMVDVSAKDLSARRAVVRGGLSLSPGIMATLSPEERREIISTARIAGIQAAKLTSQLIPMCHPISLKHVDVSIDVAGESFVVETTTRALDGTGVEMEALTAASVAALTVYDMCKAAHKGIVISEIKLLAKDGGKSGPWRAAEGDQRGAA